MKIATSDREIERHDVQTENKFSIRATGKAFRILSSALYTDKILAVVRELSCNAYDSHVAAGCANKPFHVHLPNALEPFFSVRDEGIGLSPEDIVSVYTTYFASTKTDSNDYIGGLGLGSKTPFSYVDSFSIKNIFDGFEYNYAAFIAEDGEPSLVLMSEMPSLAHNGIEVSMPVKYNNDFSVFRERAKSILSRFKTKPIVTGCVGFEFYEYNPLVTGNGWVVVKQDYHYAQPYAIMGQVAYPISSHAIGSLSNSAGGVYSCPIEIEFPVGSLDVTAGREELSYDRNTLKALEDRAIQILADVPTAFSSAINRCKTEREARQWYDKINTSKITGLFGPYPKYVYKNKTISSSDFNVDKKDIGNFELVSYEASYSKYLNSILNAKSGHDRLGISSYENATVAIDDMNGKGKSRINFRRRENTEENLYIFSGDKAEIEAFIKKHLDGFEPILVSSFAKPEKKKKVSAPVDKLRKLVLVQSRVAYRKSNSYLWQYKDFDPKSGGVYVEKYSYSPHAAGRLDSTFFSKMIDVRTVLSLDRIDIYGFSKSEAEKYRKLGNWIELNEYLETELKNFIDNSDFFNFLNLTSLKNRYPGVSRNVSKLERISNYLPDGHLVRDCSKMLKSPSTASYEKYNALVNLQSYYPSLKLDAKYEWCDQWEKVIKKYPLMSILNGSMNDIIDNQSFVDYINWIDSKTI